MDSPDFSTGKSPRSLQGPRPAPLRVHKDSHKISKKPPVVPQHHHLQPQQHHHHLQQHHHQQQQQQQQHRPPVIIYTVSPKVIHTNPNEFMTLVQRLTGPSAQSPIMGGASSSSSYPSSAFQDDGGAVSPAARFASIEKAVKSPPPGRTRQQQPLQSQNTNTNDADFETTTLVEQTSYFPSILSPAPGSLPPIPPNFFSPLSNDFFHDLSPALHSSRNSFSYMMEGNHFLPSPTNYIISPTTPNPNFDLFHSLFDL